MDVTKQLKTVDGYTIAAVHTISSGSSVVLWLHGIAVDKDEYLGFYRDGAKHLQEAGVDSLRIDFRGHGESTGVPADFTIAGQITDVECAIMYLVEHYSGDVRICIVGTSFGAPPAVFAAAMNPGVVKRLILISPVLSYRRTFLQPESPWAKQIFSPEAIAALPRTGELPFEEDFSIGLQLFQEMKIVRPDLEIGELQQPVTIIHGEVDAMIPFGITRDIVQRLPAIELIAVPNMGHGFVDEADDTGAGAKSRANMLRIFDIVVNRTE